MLGRDTPPEFLVSAGWSGFSIARLVVYITRDVWILS